MKKLFTISFALLFLLATAAVAGDETAKSKQAASGSKETSFEGTLVCLGCSLKKDAGARAECTEHGHKHAVKTADGRFINLLENKYSMDLINGGAYQNKPVTVTGVYFASANLMDVQSFAVEGEEKSWCATHSKMDGCSMAQQ